jgi:hypothetical protein
MAAGLMLIHIAERYFIFTRKFVDSMENTIHKTPQFATKMVNFWYRRCWGGDKAT